MRQCQSWTQLWLCLSRIQLQAQLLPLLRSRGRPQHCVGVAVPRAAPPLLLLPPSPLAHRPQPARAARPGALLRLAAGGVLAPRGRGVAGGEGWLEAGASGGRLALCGWRRPALMLNADGGQGFACWGWGIANWGNKTTVGPSVGCYWAEESKKSRPNNDLIFFCLRSIFHRRLAPPCRGRRSSRSMVITLVAGVAPPPDPHKITKRLSDRTKPKFASENPSARRRSSHTTMRKPAFPGDLLPRCPHGPPGVGHVRTGVFIPTNHAAKLSTETTSRTTR